MAGLIVSTTGLTFQEGTGLQFQTENGTAGLVISTATGGSSFLLLADATSFLLLTTGSDDKIILAN